MQPRLRTAGFDDYPHIATLQEANGLYTKPFNEWRHLWESNPAYRQQPEWPIGWVLEEKGGRIVGVLENVPCYYRFGGRTRVAAFGRGWAVDAAFRAFSLLLLVRQGQQPGVDLLMTSTANPISEKILTSTGWLRVPAGTWDQSAFWIASYSQAVPRYLAAKAPRMVAALAAPLLMPALLLTDALASVPHRRRSHFDFCWPASFDERFDAFWDELEQKNRHVLLSIRNKSTLEWHFRYSLKQKRLWILTVNDGPKLVAYALFARRDPASLDLTRMMLVDFQTLEPDPEITSAMLRAALQRCRRESIQVLENAGCWLETKQPRLNLSPFRRSLGNWCYFYQPRNREISALLKNPESWYPTQYDTDASL